MAFRKHARFLKSLKTMYKILNLSRTQNKGFTLIELLVVVAIIGLLSSVVLASLNTARSKARDAARLTQMKQLQLALEFYHDDFGVYPPSDVLKIILVGEK
jgi:prepilin-type N-terminal cleavage/methylation domain-containing protein